MVPRHRSINESPRFASEMAAIEPDVERTDRVQESYSAAIATRAEFFPALDGTGVRYLRTRDGLGGCPSIWVYFTIDSIDYCTLQSALLAEESSPPSIFGDFTPIAV